MGKFDFQFDSNLIKQLEKLSNYDEIAEKVLNGTIPILERKVRSEVSKHKKSGDLYESIKAGKPVKNSYGWYSSVFPTGKDKKGVRNAEKLIYLEHGVSDGKGGWKQEPEPVLTKALKDAEPEVTEKMQQIFNEVVSK